MAVLGLALALAAAAGLMLIPEDEQAKPAATGTPRFESLAVRRS